MFAKLRPFHLIFRSWPECLSQSLHLKSYREPKGRLLLTLKLVHITSQALLSLLVASSHSPQFSVRLDGRRDRDSDVSLLLMSIVCLVRLFLLLVLTVSPETSSPSCSQSPEFFPRKGLRVVHRVPFLLWCNRNKLNLANLAEEMSQNLK